MCQGGNEASERLLGALNEDGRIHLVPSRVGESFFLRFAVCSSLTTPEDVKFAAGVCRELANGVLQA